MYQTSITTAVNLKAKAVLSVEIPRNILWSNLSSRDGGRGYL
jgi:hypothetical protein